MNFIVRKNLFEETGKEQLAFLVLDFNRPQESRTLLESIKRHVKFPHKVLFYSNGGDQSYISEFYECGLIDILVASRKNEGSSIGTIRLAELCPCKYFINLQCDNYLVRDLDEVEFSQMKKALTNGNGAIDFAFVGKQVFSERAFMADIEFYLNNEFLTHSGTGPFQNSALDNSEQAFTKWLKKNNKQIAHWVNRLIADNGKYAVIEVNNGLMRRRCDTHQVWVIKTPEKSMPLWNLSENDWNKILAGRWENGSIPENSVKDAFFFYSNEMDPA